MWRENPALANWSHDGLAHEFESKAIKLEEENIIFINPGLGIQLPKEDNHATFVQFYIYNEVTSPFYTQKNIEGVYLCELDL